jgi:hypothetical protein
VRAETEPEAAVEVVLVVVALVFMRANPLRESLLA